MDTGCLAVDVEVPKANSFCLLYCAPKLLMSESMKNSYRWDSYWESLKAHGSKRFQQSAQPEFIKVSKQFMMNWLMLMWLYQSYDHILLVRAFFLFKIRWPQVDFDGHGIWRDQQGGFSSRGAWSPHRHLDQPPHSALSRRHHKWYKFNQNRKSCLHIFPSVQQVGGWDGEAFPPSLSASGWQAGACLAESLSLSPVRKSLESG